MTRSAIFLSASSSLKDTHLPQRCRPIGGWRRGAPGKHIAACDRALTQICGDRFVLLVLQQTPNQLGARVEIIELIVVLILGWTRQEHLALDVRERCRHHQVFRGDVEV